MLGHGLINGSRFVELALALIVQRQVVKQVHDGIIQGAFAEFLECHVQLALALEGQPQHAIALCRFRVRSELAPLRDQKALGGQQRMTDDEHRRGHHQRYPQCLGGHEDEMRCQQGDEEAGGKPERDAGSQAGKKHDQVQADD